MKNEEETPVAEKLGSPGNGFGSSTVSTTASTSGTSSSRSKQVKFLDQDDENDDSDDEIRGESVHLLSGSRKASSSSRKFSAVGTPEFHLNVVENSNSFAEGLHHDKDQFLSNKYEVNINLITEHKILLFF